MKKRLIVIGVLAALAGLAYLLPSPYLAYAVFAFVLLLGLSNISSRAWLSGLECERSISRNTVRQGETVMIEVTLTNRHGFPIPWIFVEDYYPPPFYREGDNARLAVLMPGKSLRLRYRLRCSERGYHAIGPLMMESGDLFGLQKRFRTGVRRDYVSVLPSVAYIETYSIAARRPQGPVKISNRVYEDPTRISGVREYVRGDPLSRIHWKASAHAGELMVRQVQPAAVIGATLALDLYWEGYTGERREGRLELAITTTASIAYLLQNSGEQLGLITNAGDAAEAARYELEQADTLSREEIDAALGLDEEDDRLRPLETPTRRSPVQAQYIIENLARVTPGRGLTARDLILDRYRQLPRDAGLLPVVPQVDEELGLTLAEMKLAGFPVTVFLIANRAGHAEAAARLAPYGIDVLHIEHERDLHELNPGRIGR